MKINLKKNKGFTLVEMLVAVAVFTSVITAAFGIFVSSLQAQRKSLASQELLDQTSYVLEYMSRAIRMARKDLAGECIFPKLNYEETRGGQGLKFKNYQDICQEFFWDSDTGRLKEVKGGQENFLTSDSLQVLAWNVELVGQSQNDDLQPRVTIFLDIKGEAEKPELQPAIKIQTSISQRNLDVRK
jgi:prepilin-type N-terminal cleavage/methylation domain-containing protein